MKASLISDVAKIETCYLCKNKKYIVDGEGYVVFAQTPPKFICSKVCLKNYRLISPLKTYA